MTALAQQFGMKAESTWGTGVTPDRFYPLVSETLRVDVGQDYSQSLRASQYTDRSDQVSPPHQLGVSGGFVIEVPVKGFGVLLQLLMGGTAGVSGPTDSNYTQTHTLGTDLGKSATLQLNRPWLDATNEAFTFEGCKFPDFEFSVAPKGFLMLNATVDGESQNTSSNGGAALASVSYTATQRLFSWVYASATVGGASTKLRDWKLKVTRPLNAERYVLKAASTKEQQLRNGKILVEVSMGIEFEAMTHYNRYIATTVANRLAAHVLTIDGDIALGGATVPRMTFTTPNLNFDQVDGPNLSGNDTLVCNFVGRGLYDGSSEPLTITYRSTDSAV